MLELRGVGKSFPGVVALEDISVTFEKGEIHALLGENGAGKSTLIKIVSGFYRPDAGEVFLDGRALALKNFSEGLKRGIAVVNQEIQIIPDASVAENIMLERLGRFKGWRGIRWKALQTEAARLMALVGLNLLPGDRAGNLSAAQKQLIQIAKALSVDAKVLLLDEPTSSITRHEAEKLFEIVRGLRGQGVTIIFVSHKINEIFALCDRVTVIRDGKMVGTVPTSGIKSDDLVTMMIGREYSVGHLGLLPPAGEPVLEVRHATSPGKIEDASFSLKKGEILGFYGLVGAGRTELARLLIGEDPSGHAEILLRGKPVTIRNVSQAVHQHRVAYVTENRKEEGLILEFTVGTNIAITIWQRFRSFMTRKVRDRDVDRVCEKAVTELSIKTQGLEQVVKNLSGGNQQKVSIAKWLSADCDVFIIDEPTVGVDVGAKWQIHEIIWKLAVEKGKSVILISSDMPELITLARRILVFREHKIVGEIDGLNERVHSHQEVAEKIGAFLG